MTFIYGNHDQDVLDQLHQMAQFPWVIDYGLMADGHYGYSFPIGGVVVSPTHISPSSVGYDIGCGNTLAMTNLHADEYFFEVLPDLMQAIHAQAGFGLGAKSIYDYSDHPIFEIPDWLYDGPLPDLKDNAIAQMGTAGTSNHYIDLMVDMYLNVWIATHFGSRNLGHKVASHYIAEAGAPNQDPNVPVWLEANSSIGRQYLRDMKVAGDYARAGRMEAVKNVLEILEDAYEMHVFDVRLVNNHHNYAWFEHGTWVIRKGATPVNYGERSFIGGSMGTESATITIDASSADAIETYFSAPHGAGRTKSRNEAAGKKKKIKGKWYRKTPGTISQKDMDDWIEEYGVVLVGGGREEAPQAYRNLLGEVLSEYDYTIVDRLRPVGVAMNEDTIPMLEDMDE